MAEARRIGLTMRGTFPRPGGEVHDGLSPDWASFLAQALPGVLWTPVPNLGAGAADWALAFGLDGFLLTGGDDLGAYPARDATETALLDLALARAFPVLGVCRGMQMINRHFGGTLSACDPAVHVAAEHALRLVPGGLLAGLAGTDPAVNSFHRFGVRPQDLAPALAAEARSADGLIEGLRLPGAAVVGVLWHPERERPASDLSLRLVRTVFGGRPW